MVWHNVLEIIGYILASLVIALTVGAIVFCFCAIVAGVINDARRKKANKKYTIDISVVREDVRRMDGSGSERG